MVVFATEVSTAQEGVQDPLREELDRRRNRFNILQSRIYDPPIRLNVLFSTANIIDEPFVGFGDDGLFGGDAVQVPPAK